MEQSKFKQFDLVHKGNYNDIMIILVGPINVPYFHDGTASEYANVPLDIENPEEWQNTFTGYIVCNITNEGDYEVVAEQHIQPWKPDATQGYIPYDLGTGKLRAALGLKALGEKWYKMTFEYDSAQDDD